VSGSREEHTLYTAVSCPNDMSIRLLSVAEAEPDVSTAAINARRRVSDAGMLAKGVGTEVDACPASRR
jgi:hypothetical protein